MYALADVIVFFPCHWNPLNWTQEMLVISTAGECQWTRSGVWAWVRWCPCVGCPVLTALPGGSGPARSQTPAPSCRPAPRTPPPCGITRTTSIAHFDFFFTTRGYRLKCEFTHWRFSSLTGLTFKLNDGRRKCQNAPAHIFNFLIDILTNFISLNTQLLTHWLPSWLTEILLP